MPRGGDSNAMQKTAESPQAPIFILNLFFKSCFQARGNHQPKHSNHMATRPFAARFRKSRKHPDGSTHRQAPGEQAFQRPANPPPSRQGRR